MREDKDSKIRLAIFTAWLSTVPGEHTRSWELERNPRRRNIYTKT